MRVKEIKQLLTVVFEDTNKIVHQSAKNQRALAGLGVHAHDRMPVDRVSEDFIPVFCPILSNRRSCCELAQSLRLINMVAPARELREGILMIAVVL